PAGSTLRRAAVAAWAGTLSGYSRWTERPSAFDAEVGRLRHRHRFSVRAHEDWRVVRAASTAAICRPEHFAAHARHRADCAARARRLPTSDPRWGRSTGRNCFRFPTGKLDGSIRGTAVPHALRIIPCEVTILWTRNAVHYAAGPALLPCGD